MVYAKRPYREAWHALAYLGRYVHRVGIANSRLLEVAGGRVTFRTKGKATATLPELTFLRRLLLHVLPAQFTKVRHFGLYASPRPGGTLEKAKALLGDQTIPTASSVPTPPVANPAGLGKVWPNPDIRASARCAMGSLGAWRRNNRAPGRFAGPRPPRPKFRITIAAAPAANELVQPRNVRGAGTVMLANADRDPPPELLTVLPAPCSACWTLIRSQPLPMMA